MTARPAEPGRTPANADEQFNSERYVPVGSVVSALAILRHLASSEPLGVNALARALGLNPSSCFNILKTLVDEGFVDFDLDTKTYRLGAAPGRLFGAQSATASWMRWMRDALGQLAQDFSITCGLWEVRGDRLVLVEIAESSGATRIHMTLGQRLPRHIGAMGRCLAARDGLTLEAVSEIIPRLRWQSQPAPERFFEDMRLAARRGWSVDEGNYFRGVTTVAAPLGVGRESARYCLSSTLFSGQYDSGDVSRIGERTSALASEGALRLAGNDQNPDAAPVVATGLEKHPAAGARPARSRRKTTAGE